MLMAKKEKDDFNAAAMQLQKKKHKASHRRRTQTSKRTAA